MSKSTITLIGQTIILMFIFFIVIKFGDFSPVNYSEFGSYIRLFVFFSFVIPFVYINSAVYVAGDVGSFDRDRRNETYAERYAERHFWPFPFLIIGFIVAFLTKIFFVKSQSFYMYNLLSILISISAIYITSHLREQKRYGLDDVIDEHGRKDDEFMVFVRASSNVVFPVFAFTGFYIIGWVIFSG